MCFTMKIMCIQFMAIQFGMLVVSCMDSSYIGCYKIVDSFSPGYSMQNYSGDACVRMCCPNYTYAGVKTSVCYCGSELKGKKVDDTECDEKCQDPLFNGSCGGQKDWIISVYSIKDNENAKNNQCSYSNQSTEAPLSKAERTELSIAIAMIVVVLIIVIFVITVITRKRFMRSLDIAQTLDKSFYNNKTEATGTQHREDNVDIEDNGDVTSIQSLSMIQGEYSRLKMPDGFSFIDRNYSHINQKKRGACVVLDDGYSHLNMSGGTDKHSAKSCTCASKQFSKSGKVRKGHRFGQQQRDDSYDKIGSRALLTAIKQNNTDRKHVRCNFIIPGNTCQCDKCVKSNSKNMRPPKLVNVTLDRSSEVKRPHTYEEIEFDDE